LPSAVAVRSSSTRYWEVDALRGVAIIMMVVYHLMWDLWYFRILPELILTAGFWKYFQRTTASLFLILVGVSLTISYRRAVVAQGTTAGLFPKFLRRGLGIFALGMLITLGVWLSGVGSVHFGILHLIGFSVVAAYPLLRFRWLNLALWLVLYSAGGWMASIHSAQLWLVWLGITPQPYLAVDYFPVIPWFGVVLLGVFLGNTLYTPTGRLVPLPDLSAWLPVRGLRFLGRHSLVIYLIHQPILIAFLVLLGLVPLAALR
jgi:uncharacterized membrane protein